MKCAKTITYGMKKSLLTICPFYMALISLLILFAIMGATQGRSDVGGLGAWDILESMVAVSIVAGFRERFHLFLQNGYSRKSLFIHYLICILCIVLFMAIIEEIIYRIAPSFSTTYTPAYKSLYGGRYMEDSSLYMLESLLWHTSLFLATTSIGFLVVTAAYRLSKRWKIVIFGGIPALLMFVLPAISVLFFDDQLGPTIIKGIWRMLGLYEDVNPYVSMLSTSCISVLSLLGVYGILRKLDIQK